MCETFCPFSSQNHSYTNQMPKTKSSKLEIKDKTKDIITLTYFVQTLAYFGLATSCFCNVLGDGGDVCAESLRHDYGGNSGSSDGCDDHRSRELVVVILAIVVLLMVAMNK